MGGINCGVSNGRTNSNDRYRLEYATYSRHLFKCLEYFSRANALVEEFTLLEKEDTSKAVAVHKESLKALEAAVVSVRLAQIALKNCSQEIEPLFKYSVLRNGSIEQYKKFDSVLAKDILEESNVVTTETKVWNSVVSALQTGGEVDYLNYQQENLFVLEGNLIELLAEYKKLEKDVRLGVSYIAIRDIEVDVTPLTAVALTKMSELISSLTYLCLIEFTAHTSISGKQLELTDLIPNTGSSFNQLRHAE